MATTRILASIVIAAGLGTAAEPHPIPAHQRPPATKQAPGKPALKDAQIEADIRARFARSKIGADKFTVHVQGGIATLEGRTDVVQHKGTATRMAKSAGASAVNNHIQVSEAAKAKASANLEKGRRRAQIKRGEARSQTTATAQQSR